MSFKKGDIVRFNQKEWTPEALKYHGHRKFVIVEHTHAIYVANELPNNRSDHLSTYSFPPNKWELVKPKRKVRHSLP